MIVASIDIRRALAEASVSGLPGLLFGADVQGPRGQDPRQCREMLKYDLMLAEWASGSITNRFPIEFWVYKVISRKSHIAVTSVSSVTSVTNRLHFRFQRRYIRSGDFRSSRL